MTAPHRPAAARAASPVALLLPNDTTPAMEAQLARLVTSTPIPPGTVIDETRLPSLPRELPAALRHVCQRCGDPVPYSGQGRPRLTCERCDSPRRVTHRRCQAVVDARRRERREAA